MTSFETAAAQSREWKECLDKVNSAMASLGFDETAELTSKVAASMAVFSTMAQLTAITRSAVAFANRKLTAEVSAEIAANSWHPAGWVKIGLAAAGMAAAMAVCTSLMSHTSVQSDLSSPSGRTAAAQTVGAMA